MKSRLLVVKNSSRHDAGAMRHAMSITRSVSSNENLEGTVIKISGEDYYVIEQFPAKKSVNAAKKSMKYWDFKNWLFW